MKNQDGTTIFSLETAPEGFRGIGATPYLNPVPAVLLACADPEAGQRPNLCTVAWAGVCCSHPPMVGVSLRKERHSYGMVARTGQFTLNLVGQPLLRAMDYCGVKSGRDVDKFTHLGLTPAVAHPLDIAPGLAQSPAFLCCQVRQVHPLGSHDLFLAEVVQVHVQERFFTDSGAIDEGKMELVAYVHGKYRAIGTELGFFGFSVAGREALRRRMPKRG